MADEFKTHILNARGLDKAKRVQMIFEETLTQLDEIGIIGRERSLVITKLQEASMFAKRAVAMQPENQVPTVLDSQNSERGFTLIELMIVVAIIGVLAAVAIPAFMDYMKKSKNTEAPLQLRHIAEKCKDYWITHSDYPPSSTSSLPGIDGAACPSKFPTLAATTWSVDPAWGAIDFHIDNEALFTYHFTHTSQTSANATAVGDLDCDTTLISYSLDMNTVEGNQQSKVYTPADLGQKD